MLYVVSAMSSTYFICFAASGNHLWRNWLLEAMAFHVLFIFNLLRFSDPWDLTTPLVDCDL